MNLTELLKFVPLILGLILAYHLIFKQNLPSKGLWSIITYFLGIIIVLFAVGWLIVYFVAGWMNDLLASGATSSEWQQLFYYSEEIVKDAFGGGSSASKQTPTPIPPTAPPQIIVLTPTPGNTITSPPTGPTQYTVVAGDTLTSIAGRYGITVSDLMIANNLTSDLIHPGQVLIIPPPT